MWARAGFDSEGLDPAAGQPAAILQVTCWQLKRPHWSGVRRHGLRLQRSSGSAAMTGALAGDVVMQLNEALRWWQSLNGPTCAWQV